MPCSIVSSFWRSIWLAVMMLLYATICARIVSNLAMDRIHVFHQNVRISDVKVHHSTTANYVHTNKIQHISWEPSSRKMTEEVDCGLACPSVDNECKWKNEIESNRLRGKRPKSSKKRTKHKKNKKSIHVQKKKRKQTKDGDLYEEKMDLINEKIGMSDDKERLLKDSIRKVN